MKNYLSKVFLTGLTAVTVTLFPFPARAADEQDIIEAEKQLIQKESQLLEPEQKLDRLLVDRAKLDGMSGWFQGGKKKALEAQMEVCNNEINAIHNEMKSLQQKVQEVVFSVAHTYEQKGQYKKAIEYYLKVKKQDDKVIFRIATCYKAMTNYNEAIQWFLKLAKTDANHLEIVDCYKLAAQFKEAIYWLFQILEPFEGNSAELTALKLIEEYDYPQKMNDYPEFNQRLSDIYLTKTVLNYKNNFSQAKEDYEKAVVLISGNSSPQSVSFSILTRYQNKYKAALDVLEEQKKVAERNYENMLREARNKYERAEDRLRKAQRDAEDQYARRLEDARREMDRAQWTLDRLIKEGAPETELATARQDLESKKNIYRHIQMNHINFVEDHVRPYRRDRDVAYDEYRRIQDSRTEIIERFIAPYKAEVAKAKKYFEMFQNLHESIYGMK